MADKSRELRKYWQFSVDTVNSFGSMNISSPNLHGKTGFASLSRQLCWQKSFRIKYFYAYTQTSRLIAAKVLSFKKKIFLALTKGFAKFIWSLQKLLTSGLPKFAQFS